MLVRYTPEAARHVGPHTNVSGQVIREARAGDKVCAEQCMCVHAYIPMLVSRSLQSLSPMSLPPEAKRDCPGFTMLTRTQSASDSQLHGLG